MKKLVGYWREALRDEWNPLFFFIFGAFLLLSVALNYTLRIDDAVESLQPRPWVHLAACTLYYSIPYYFGVVSYALCYQRMDLLRNRGYLLISFAGILIYAATAGNWSIDWLGPMVPRELYRLVMRAMANLVPAGGGMLALLLVWGLLHRAVAGYYGLFAPKTGLGPYFGFLALGMPFVILATFSPDFTAMYPRYPHTSALGDFGITTWQAVLGFEICYGIAFVYTEVFFRGFLVLGLGQRVGAAAVMPMVGFYCFIHFGKPLGEALASIAGGWALGVIAYRTRSIRGGVVFHLGVAYSLELCAWLQRAWGSHPP